MAALAVFSAVFTAFCVDFTVPFAPGFYCLFPGRASRLLDGAFSTLRRFDGLVSSAPDACPCGLRILPRCLPCSLFSRRSAWRAPTQLLLIAANPFFIFVDALFIAVLPVRLLAFFNGFFRLAGNLVPNLIGHILSGIADFVLRVLGGGNLPIVHQVFCLILRTDKGRLHALGGNSRFIKNLDILNALSCFYPAQSHRLLSKQAVHTFFATITKRPLG